MSEKSIQLGNIQKSLSQIEGTQRAATNMAILLFSFGMLFLTLYLQNAGAISFTAMLTCTTAMMGSFGPVVALSSLSNNLNQTLASGERVLSILEETPIVEEIPVRTVQKTQKNKIQDTIPVPVKLEEASANEVTFAYEERKILNHFNFQIQPGKITGIHGSSGAESPLY